MTFILAVFLGLNSNTYGGEVEVILKDETENSGFTVKEESTGSTIARFAGAGNVGIGTSTPRANLDVNGDFIRKIARVHGTGPVILRGGENIFGPVEDRELSFTKKYDNTGIRVTYIDRRAVTRFGSSPNPVIWEIRFNGNSCTNPDRLGPMLGVLGKDSRAEDIEANATFIGTAFGLAAGTYTIQIYITLEDPSRGYLNTIATGGGYWSLEAEEVW